MALFVALVQHGSFSKTAESLNLPQSTLSRKINELESELGLTLLHRTTRKMALTEAGQFYFERASIIITEAECTHQALFGMKVQPEGVLKMSVTVEFAHEWLVKWLPEFQSRYPNIQLQIDVSPHKADLMAHDVDLAIRAGEISESHYIAQPLMSVNFYLYASPDYLVQHGCPTSPQALSQHHLLPFLGAKQWVLCRHKQRVLVPLHLTYQSNSFSLLKNWVQQGLGIAMLPEMIVPQNDSLQRILPDWQGQSAPISILTATRLLPLKVKCMVDFLKEKIQAA